VDQRYSSDNRGRRSEDVACWYFRLNGFLTIPGFVVHPDQRQRFPRTEADLLGVRFPHSREWISTRPMDDDSPLTRIDDTCRRTVFVLVEVKTDLCDINGPWSDRERGNMQRVVRRLGFTDEPLVAGVAERMYDSARWEDDEYVLQYICVGARKNDGMQLRFPDLRQISWSEMADFFWNRFGEFPEKLPDGRPVHAQWPDFGRKYGAWFTDRSTGYRQDPVDHGGQLSSRSAVSRYIETGDCLDQRGP
jgi:hypothetical protein